MTDAPAEAPAAHPAMPPRGLGIRIGAALWMIWFTGVPVVSGLVADFTRNVLITVGLGGLIALLLLAIRALISNRPTAVLWVCLTQAGFLLALIVDARKYGGEVTWVSVVLTAWPVLLVAVAALRVARARRVGLT